MLSCTIHATDPNKYVWGDEEESTVQQFTCTTHAGEHTWKYVKHTNGSKVILDNYDAERGAVSCADFDSV